jgi:hypothetical protein
VVDRSHGFGEEARIAKGDAEDEATDAHALRFRRGRRQRGDGFETLTRAVLMRRLLKVIGDREPVEVTRVGEVPQPSQLVERPA